MVVLPRCCHDIRISRPSCGGLLMTAPGRRAAESRRAFVQGRAFVQAVSHKVRGGNGLGLLSSRSVRAGGRVRRSSCRGRSCSWLPCSITLPRENDYPVGVADAAEAVADQH
jgi:hypothetical protein